MVLDAEDAAGFQRAVYGGEHFRRVALAHPVVQVAEGQDEVDAARRREVVVVLAQRADVHATIDRGVRCEPGLERRRHDEVGVLAAAARRGGDGEVVAAGGVQVGGEDLGPVTAAGPDLDDAGMGRDAEKASSACG